MASAKETTITLEVSIHRANTNETHIIKDETRLELTHETRLNAIAQFEREATTLIKKARKASAQGHFVFVDVTKAIYNVPYNIDGSALVGSITQDKFEIWSGRGDDITEDGAYLTPSKQFGQDQCHDLYLTGKDILRELTL